MARLRCVCARHADGSVTTMLCSVHAETDPCLTMAQVTGRRRTGTIRRGVCTSCGHGQALPNVTILDKLGTEFEVTQTEYLRFRQSVRDKRTAYSRWESPL